MYNEPGFFEKIVLKLGIAQDTNGARKVIAVLAFIILIVTGFYMYSSYSSSKEINKKLEQNQKNLEKTLSDYQKRLNNNR